MTVAGITPSVYQAVSPVFRSAGVPDYIWMAIADMETGGTFDVRATGDNGRSFGLFQLFTAGGQGDAYAGQPEVLYDPGTNATVAAPAIVQAYQVGKALGMQEGPELAAYVAANSGHPGFGLSLDYPAVAIVRTKAAGYYAASAGPAGGGDAGGGSPTGSWRDAWNRFWFGQNPDGSARSGQQYRDAWGQPWDPDDYPADPGPIPGDLPQQAVKKGVQALFPDTLGSSEWWKQAGVYAVAAVVAVVVIGISLAAMVRPGAKGA